MCLSALQRRALGAFTLVELLVSIAVFLIIAVVMFGILEQVSLTWIRGQGQVEREETVRALLNRIGSDLRSAMQPVNAASQNNLQMVLNPPGLIPASTYCNPNALFWQAPVATDQTLGDMAEVGYFVQWDQSHPSNPRAQLCRFLVNPSDTVNYLIYSSPSSWITGSELMTVSPANSANNYQGLFAENILGLWVRCMDSSGNVISGTTFDSRTGYVDPGTGRTLHLPVFVEVSLAIIDSQGAAHLTATTDITSHYADAFIGGQLRLDNFVAQLPVAIRSHVRTYSTQVFLPNAL